MSMFVLCVAMSCGRIDRYNVSDEHTASIFCPEDGACFFVTEKTSFDIIV
jgi:hypothetical protein